MVGSLKNNVNMSRKDHFKIFLKFCKSYFEDLSFKPLDAELVSWDIIERIVQQICLTILVLH